ncbi:MlaD family protein [Sulfurimonas sp.]|uniref:MlaD family protein n=1 Tax=Sulfurimonas sp. TaxID=2022749 RepID=UPI003D0C2BD2
MNNKVNYTLVGLAVLISFGILSVFSYWMLKPSHMDENKHYVIYFDESVFGLNLDAPVKFRGIRVGKVSKLRINPNNSEQVEVQVNILKDTPIKNNIVAILTAQGITGLTYVNLTVGDTYATKTVMIEDEEFQVIATAPSIFKNIQKSLGNVSDHLTTTLYQAEKLLDDKNQQEMMKLISSTRDTMEKLSRALDDKTIDHFHSAVANLDSTIEKFEGLIDHTVTWENKIATSLESIMNSYKKIDAAMTEFKRAVSSGEFNVKEISAEVVPNINNTLIQLQESMIKLDGTLKEYERSPSDILFKRQEIKKAPGE